MKKVEVSLETTSPKEDNVALFLPALLAVSYYRSGYSHEFSIHFGILLWGLSIKFEWPI